MSENPSANSQATAAKTLIIFGAGVLVLGLLAYVLYNREPAGSGHALPQVSAGDFDQLVMKADKPVLVDFYADWCGPCNMMEPTLVEFARENPQVKVMQVNVDDSPALAEKYKITGVPTLMLFDQGRLVDRASGAKSKSGLQKFARCSPAPR